MQAHTISLYIAASPATVYAFAADPQNLPQWVPSFCKSITWTNDEWVVQSPDGPATFQFVDANPFGVLDHTIVFPSGLTLVNPMRVIANGSGSEVVFTLFQHEGMSDQQFVEDAASVHTDLELLRGILEDHAPR